MSKLVINLPDTPGILTVHLDYALFVPEHGFRPCSVFHKTVSIEPNVKFSLVFHNTEEV